MNRLGRNDLCFCGSGKKYKKCCLFLAEEEKSTSDDWMEHFLEDHPFDAVINPDGINSYKMSEVLFDYVSDLLELTDTYEQKKEVLFLCVFAWNLSLLSDDQISKAMDTLLEKVNVQKNSLQDRNIRGLLRDLIERKQEEYPLYNRFIYKFSLRDEGDDIRLYVLSSDVPFETEEQIDFA